jgi:hypothetical protein
MGVGRSFAALRPVGCLLRLRGRNPEVCDQCASQLYGGCVSRLGEKSVVSLQPGHGVILLAVDTPGVMEAFGGGVRKARERSSRLVRELDSSPRCVRTYMFWAT